jgi:hypothetical protein
MPIHYRFGEPIAGITEPGALLRESESLPLEVHREEHWSTRENDGPFDRVLQLAHISRPFISLQERERFGGEAAELLFRVARRLRAEPIREQRYVFGALSQRRQLDRNYAEPEEEISSKPTSLGFG